MTVRQIISRARGHWTDVGFDDIRGLEYVQEVHNKILRLVRVKPDEDVVIPLVANQRYYTLDTAINRIWNAMLFNTSASDFKPLYPRSVDELDQETRGIWRAIPAGTPIWYDERSGQLMLHPMPDTSASGGYPSVTLSVQKTDALTLESTLPVVDVYDAWVFGLCKKYAEEKDTMFMRSSRAMMRSPFPLQLQKYNALYSQAMNDLIAWSEGKSAREMPNIAPAIPTPRII